MYKKVYQMMKSLNFVYIVLCGQESLIFCNLISEEGTSTFDMFLMKDVCVQLFFIIKNEDMSVAGIVLPQASFAGPRKLGNLKEIICHLESEYHL